MLGTYCDSQKNRVPNSYHQGGAQNLCLKVPSKSLTLDCLIQALVRIAILLYLIPFKWCEYKTPCSPLKKHGANRRHGVLNRKKPILISLAWCTFFKNTGGNIKQNFDMLYQFQKNGVNIRHDVLFQKLMVLLKGMMYFFKKYWCE